MAKWFLATGDIPVDRCWSLLPLFMICALLAMLIPKNSAVFYVAFMEEFGVSHQSASWPLSLNNVMMHIAGRLRIYQIAVLGSMLNFMALIASSFVPSITWMCVTLGIASGVGVGMNLLCLSIYAMLYFDRYRATASGFKYAGTSLAPLIFPMVLSALIRHYHLQGTLLILSAFTANTLPLTMLMKSPKPITSCFWKKRGSGSNPTDCGGTKKNCSASEGSGTIVADSGCTVRAAVETTGIYTSNGVSFTGGVAVSSTLADYESEEKSKDVPQIINKKCHDEYAATVSKPRHANATTPAGKTKEFGSPGHAISGSPLESPFAVKIVQSDYAKIPKTQNQYVTGPAGEPTTSNSELQIRGDRSKTSFFRNPLLYILVATFTIADYTSVTFEATVLDYALDKGVARNKAEPIISYVATSEIVGRLALPFLWEKARLKQNALLVICLLAQTVSFLVMPHATTPVQIVAAAMATGLPAGCVIALKPVLFSNTFGVQRLSICMGVIGIALTPVSLAGPLLIGVFRDGMGSYDNLYRMMSALCITFALAVFAFARLKMPSARE
ncbi:hypothetical protein HPB48_001333 [Haemaphysalis longicornis]|uniref:Monocarboxylate transporter n=1 Tax=Haemaphysalis longicornis TaxID=44386 RepID=A0A9J6GP55_HAELO|nr:hypothetical protein HPB48_001333 [Haemaphysalis longicornis]